MLVLWCHHNTSNEKVHSRMECFTILQPQRLNSDSLYHSLLDEIKSLGISASAAPTCKKLVGIATDGAAANIALAGLKGFVKDKIPWIFWMWCLAHWFELSIKEQTVGY